MLLNPLKKIKIGAVIEENPIHSIYSLEKSYSQRNINTIRFPVHLTMDEIVSGLNELQPDVLLGLPSSINQLLTEAASGRLTIRAPIVSVFGEPFYKEMRKKVEKTWPGVEIFNTFGTSEGLAAACCKSNAQELHLNDDLCIVEPVDKNGHAIATGNLSNKIYITNLFNYTLPLVRYEIHDEMMFLNKKCICGSEYQLVAEPQGRPQFDFTYQHDVFVHHNVFASPLLNENNILEYQVFQTAKGADIKILTSNQFDKTILERTISNSLSNLGISDPTVYISNVDSFNYPPSGKLRRFIPIEKKD